MEEPTCITSCLICESQLSPSREGKNGEDTDMRTLVSILKKILLQQNEVDVKPEKENSEATRLFCPGCTEILDEWREIQGWMSKLLARSKDIKYRLIANILKSNVSLPGQLLDSAAFQEYLDDFAVVKRAVINEYRPRLRLERLEEIPLDALRNCFDSNFQNDAPVDFLENSTGFDHEDCHDDWETPTFDATDGIEIECGGQSDDELNIRSGSTSGHVMKTRKRKRCPPTERHDAGENKRIKRTVAIHENGDIFYDGKYIIKLCGEKYACPMCGMRRKGKYNIIEHIRENHIRAETLEGVENKRIKRPLVELDNGDILYDGKYTIKLCGEKYECPFCSVQRQGKYFILDHIREDHIQAKTDFRRKKRTVVELDNGDFIYDGQYTIRLYGEQYLCPVCGLQRNKKHGITEHILQDHIRGNGSNEITSVGENTFLYRNQYGFTFSKMRYKCSTCGTTDIKRRSLIDHIQVSHVNGADEAMGIGKVTDQTMVLSSSRDEYDVNEPENAEYIEVVPDLHQPESSDREVEREEGSDDEQEPVTEDIDRSPRGPRNTFRCLPITDNVFLYAGKYRIVLKNGRYQCPKCSCQRRKKFAITQHIREIHMKCVVSQNVRPFNRIVAINENEFTYGGKYRITKINNRYYCSECSASRSTIEPLTDHIRADHIWKKEKLSEASATENSEPEDTALPTEVSENDTVETSQPRDTQLPLEVSRTCSTETTQPEGTYNVQPENQSSEVNMEQATFNASSISEDHEIGDKKRNRRTIVVLENGDILYDGKYTIRLYGGQYLCPLCGILRKGKHRMTEHILGDHIRGKGTNEIIGNGENSFLYLNQYGFTFSDNQYKCTTCGIALAKRFRVIDHIQVSHINRASETSEVGNSQPEDTQLPPEVSETCTIETSQPEGTQLSSYVQTDDASETQRAIESIQSEVIQSEACHMPPGNQSSEYKTNQETSNAESDENGEYKGIKRTIIVLENGDILYDGKYTIKLCGKKYLCPVCGLQRNTKYSITQHVRVDHIVANGPSTPEFTGVGEYSFLYLNQYGFSFSNGQYTCTTCGLTHVLRHYLLHHIQVSHVNGADKAIHAGKVKGQPLSSLEQDANEADSAENTEQDPDWHQSDSSDSEAQSEQDSDDDTDEEESVTKDTNKSSSGTKKHFKCIAITQNVFLYADKYRIVFKAGRYQCPKCSCTSKRKLVIMQHIRGRHIKPCVVPQKVVRPSRIVTINENEFMYGGKYRIRKINDRYFCSECPVSRASIKGLTVHMREEHIRQKEVPEVMPESDDQSSMSKTARNKLTKTGPNEYIYGGQVRISMNDGVFDCGSCGAQMKTLKLMRHHVNNIHIRRGNDEFYKSVQPLEDGTFKCGKCDFIGKNWNSLYGHIQNHKNSLKRTGNAVFRKQIFSVEVSPNHFDHGGWPYKFVPETGRFNCGSCNWTFRTKQKMLSHIAVFHKNSIESAICEECGKVFASKDKLRSHKVRHRPKTIPCPECGKLFSNQHDLGGHMKIHLGDAAKKNVCEFCGKRFYKLNQLEKHRATHTGEAPYNCDECGLGYRTQRELKNHQSTKHPKEIVSNNVPAVDANDAVVSIEIVDGDITDISSLG